MLVADCMTKTPIVIGPTESLAAAMELMSQHHIRHLPVVDKARHLVGFITDRDLRRAAPSMFQPNASDPQQLLEGIAVERVMIRSPATTVPTQRLADLVKLMIEKKYGALPVLDGQRLVGIVSTIDVLRVALRLFP